MMETDGNFYLGRIFDAAAGETTAKPLLYDPDDLTTHGVVVGMTGSGKTGLCIDLLEEAALNDVPALMIDPKGDITNALLHFPDLAPSDFQPWINPDEARRGGKTIAQAAADTADLWRSGLAQWDVTPERIQRLKESAQFAVYTPGSDAGLPVSILASLAAPEIPWSGNEELLREKISGTVTALLGLIGLKDIDPVRSREHILLANIFEQAWRRGDDLDLGELIMQTQNPPFEKLGVFDVNTFFPEKDRFELAMLLNNMLAAPAFQAWIEGEPLDVQRLLYMPDGTPRHTIFYIAHLNDAERMFFVTLLYTAVETWMRAQSGTTSLRAVIYFDEIFGYLPPVGNPPSKEPMLRLLKQARAFGVGMLLATQNPVDLDYKALSNAGTWFIGKLATEQDKARLLDGLASAVPGGLDTREYDRLISALGKRVFLLRNVHEKQPILFQTRWAMNYLAGPVTRTKIPALNALAGADASGGAEGRRGRGAGESTQPPIPDTQSPIPDLPGTTSQPAVPGRVGEYFLPRTLTLREAAEVDGRSLPIDAREQGILYRPLLLAQAHVRYTKRKYNLDVEKVRTALVMEPNRRGVIRWQQHEAEVIEPRRLERSPLPDARFINLEAPLNEAKTIRSMQSDFEDWIYRSGEVQVQANEELDVYAGPDVPDAEFEKLCADAAAEKREEEIDDVEADFEKRLERIYDKLEREERELAEDEAEYAQRKREEAVKHVETIIGLFTRRRRSVSSSMTKRRMTAKAKADVEESEEAIAEFKKEIDELKAEMEEALAEVHEKWDEIAVQKTLIPVSPYKKDINVDLFGVAWLPHYLVAVNGRLREIPAYNV